MPQRRSRSMRRGRHCEERERRSNPARHFGRLDCFASLAMTTGWGRGRTRIAKLRAAAAALLVISALAPVPARADNYPSKTITIIAPASPGGVTDLLARMLARRFIADWGAQAIVENKPGANNQVAAEYVARQAGDGYTLFIGPETTFIVNPSLYAHLAYDPVKDFTPIAGLVSINHALALNPSVPAGSVKDLIALGQAKPGQLNYGDYASARAA